MSYDEEAQPELVEGGTVEQDKLPERILLASQVVEASIGGYSVAAAVLTLSKRDDEELNPEGLVVIFTREDALTLSSQLRSIASSLKTMQSQLDARNINPQGDNS